MRVKPRGDDGLGAATRLPGSAGGFGSAGAVARPAGVAGDELVSAAADGCRMADCGLAAAARSSTEVRASTSTRSSITACAVRACGR
jgi:hypothetical protein